MNQFAVWYQQRLIDEVGASPWKLARAQSIYARHWPTCVGNPQATGLGPGRRSTSPRNASTISHAPSRGDCNFIGNGRSPDNP